MLRQRDKKQRGHDALDGCDARDKVHKFDRSLAICEVKVDPVSDLLDIDGLHGCEYPTTDVHE